MIANNIPNTKVLNKNGYGLLKSNFKEAELQKARRECTVKPFVVSDYNKPEPFEIYRESKKFLYVPKFYGLSRYGPPENIKIDEGEKIDSFVALLPTAPLRNSNDIDSAIKFFNDKNAGSVISVVEAPVPMEWYKKIDSQGILRNLLEKKAGLKNRQEFKSQFVPNGAIYIFNTERLRSTREYYNEKTFPYVMPPERSADIDNLIDFKWAEFLLTHQ